MKKIVKLVFIGVLVAAAVAYVKLARTAVVAHQVGSSAVVAEVMGTGTLEARIRTTISPRIQERLAEVLADQGDTVRDGQLLARLDEGEIRAQVAVAAATLSAARATVEKVKADEPARQRSRKLPGPTTSDQPTCWQKTCCRRRPWTGRLSNF